VKIMLIASTGVGDGGLAARREVAAYPNPFASGTTITFDLERNAEARLIITDIAGRRVRELAGGFLPAGTQRVRWDGLDDAGHRVAPGSYFARVEAGGAPRTARLIRIR
jgi:flagellar hook assembly protein FlgD